MFTPPPLIAFNKSFTFERFCALFAPEIRKSGPGIGNCGPESRGRR